MKRAVFIAVVVFALSGTTRRALAQDSGTSDLVRAITALEHGAYEDAEQALHQVIKQDRSNAKAYYFLAQLYLDTSLRDPRKAGDAIDKALALKPDEVPYLELHLRQYLEDSTSIAPRMERLAIRRRLAENILEHDLSNALAMEELGAAYLDDLHWNVYAASRFKTQYFKKRVQRSYQQAHDQLQMTIQTHPMRKSTYRLLMQLYVYADDVAPMRGVLAQMMAYFSDDADTWLYQGLVHHFLNEPEGAASSFDKALGLLPDDERAVFDDLMRVCSVEQEAQCKVAGDTFWAIRDPRLLTATNERENEHYARLVYADLLYGEPRRGLRGWDTARGDILIRYGRPADVMLTNSRYNTLPLWNYGDFVVRFEDPFRNGEYRFYSPPADAYSGSVVPTDFVLIARALKRKVPERYTPHEIGRRVAFPYLISVFKGTANGQAAIVASLGIPLSDHDTPLLQRVSFRTGVFLLSDTQGVVGHDQRTATGIAASQIVESQDASFGVFMHTTTAFAGRYQLSVEFETKPDGALGFYREEIAVPEYREDDLSMSDVLLAYVVEEAEGERQVHPGRLVRKGWSMIPAPSAVFRLSQPLYLYFETYGLTKDDAGNTRYQVEAILVEEKDQRGIKNLVDRMLGRRSAEGTSLKFDKTGTATDEGQYFILDIQDQDPGSYVLAVRITDLGTGAKTERYRPLILK
jgi:GWxTD domain-containing protein